MSQPTLAGLRPVKALTNPREEEKDLL